MMDEETCNMCGVGFGGMDTKVTVKKLGLRKLISISEEIEDNKHLDWINQDEIIVHKSCQVSYLSKSNISAAKKRKLSEVMDPEASVSNIFDFKKLCIFCGLICDQKTEIKKSLAKRRKICSIMSDSSIRERLLKACEKGDEESVAVLGRIVDIEDLSSVGAKYHVDCCKQFFGQREYEKQENPTGNSKFSVQFEKLFDYLENAEDCQWTFEDLQRIMGNPLPSSQYIKDVLKNKFGDNIIFTRRGPLKTIVTLKGLNDNILKDFFKSHLPTESETDRKLEVLKLAAQYIREDIRASEQEVQYYPSSTEFFDNDCIKEVIPKSLVFLLEEIILPYKKDKEISNRKVISIAHAIMSATRPNSFISALLLSLSLYIHSNHASKLLINILNRLGFCASYDEALLYEGSAVMASVPTLQPTEDSFLQFIHDNADYDVNTLDGKNTFHYTGAEMVITPASSVALSLSIERLNPPPKASEIAAKYKVPEYDYTKPEVRGLSQIVIEDIRKLRPLQSTQSYFLTGEVIWITGHWLKIPKHPGWNGFMELRSNSSLYETSKIKFLPFIYLKATDDSALYTAIIFSLREAKKYGQNNFFFTFDQQLYIKAREIVADVQSNRVQSLEKMDKVFIRLGGFHLIMSYLGCIGKIMDGSGIQEAWKTIYAEKSTEKMLSGKHYSRSLRANYYTESALLIMVLNECDFNITEKRQIQTAVMYEPNDGELKTKECEKTVLEKLEINPITSVVTNKITEKMNEIAKRGKTASLWIQFIKMVSLVRSFIQAERTGDFDLHLSTIIEMLPFFHSCRHFNYAKSAHLYVQDMLQLESKMNCADEFKKYTKGGFFTIRRSDKFFCGVSPDMVMEQTLMCSIHSIPGFCHGRGFTESVIASWLNTQTYAAYINEDLLQFCGVKGVYSEQHKDFRDSTIARDEKDLKALLEWFQNHSPFPSTDKIMSIATGITGGPDVNCYDAENLGIKSINSIVPKEVIGDNGEITTTDYNFLNVKFDSDLQVIPLSTSNGSITIGKNKYPIDAKVIFNRFTRSTPDKADYPIFFEYELSPYPLSIFESAYKLRHTDEDSFSVFHSIATPNLTDQFYIVDGETLLTSIAWPKIGTYQDIYSKYAEFIRKHFGAQCVIIFATEGNEISNPILSERLLNSGVKVSTEIFFDATKGITDTQKKLFTNNQNKARFITQLLLAFTRLGINTKFTQKDADREIVDVALEKYKEDKSIVIVSNNIDTFCLLASSTLPEQNIYFRIPEKAWYSTAVTHQQYNDLTSYLSVIRAMTGCQTTSNFFRVTQKTAMKTLTKDKTIDELLRVFISPLSSNNLSALIHAGEELIMIMYKKAKSGEVKSLDEMRCKRYIDSLKTSRKTEFNLATLPPTRGAAEQHILRAYWQVQRWYNNTLPATSWGWTIVNNLLIPVTTSLPPVPEKLIGLITCNCKKNCKPKTCTCIKSGLLCSKMCKNCTDITCTNKLAENPFTEDLDGVADAEDFNQED